MEVPVMLRFVLTLIVSALLAAAAAADNPRLTPRGDEVGAQRLMKLMDVNRDGVISREEFLRHNANRAHWRELDISGDGMLDAVEQAAGVRPGHRIVR
jgi:Ca2+-binding EF-hand superfamily protein